LDFFDIRKYLPNVDNTYRSVVVNGDIYIRSIVFLAFTTVVLAFLSVILLNSSPPHGWLYCSSHPEGPRK